MPGYVLLIVAATALVVVLCLALWVMDEAAGEPRAEHDTSDRPQSSPTGTRHPRGH